MSATPYQRKDFRAPARHHEALQSDPGEYAIVALSERERESDAFDNRMIDDDLRLDPAIEAIARIVRLGWSTTERVSRASWHFRQPAPMTSWR